MFGSGKYVNQEINSKPDVKKFRQICSSINNFDPEEEKSPEKSKLSFDLENSVNQEMTFKPKRQKVRLAFLST